MNEPHKVLRTMEVYGGGFASALAIAWQRTDMRNFARLAETFADLYTQYDAMTTQIKAQRQSD